MVSVAMLVAGTISAYSLWSMKRISADNGKELGENAANDAEEALELPHKRQRQLKRNS